MKRFDTVAIVGVGMVGGSIGMALRKRGLAEKVVGIGHRQVSLRTARRVGAITSTTVDLAKGVAEADLVVVCTPVGRIIEDVRRVAEHCPAGTLITDVGSAKLVIVEALDDQLPRDCRFLGSHPLSGMEKAGAANGDAELFEGRVAIITPTKNTRAEDFDTLEQFWSDLGSVVIQFAAAEHDRAVAVTSHLPHAVAAVLAAMVPEVYFRLAATGLTDTTRIAAGDPALWQQIFAHNRDNMLAALGHYGQRLAALRAAIAEGNRDEVEKLLTIAKKNRDALGS